MQIFSFAFDPWGESFAQTGHVLLQAAVRPEFLDFARAQAQTAFQTVAGSFDVADKKRQALFMFPGGLDLMAELMRPLAKLFGLEPEGLTLSERHLKLYLSEAPARPVPHKDRLASEFAVGIPLEVAAGSYLALYPDQDRRVNAYASVAAWRERLAPEQRPENLLRDIEPLKLVADPGDLVAFLGSSILHERYYAAGSLILYLKFNTLGLDPLGEHLS